MRTLALLAALLLLAFQAQAETLQETADQVPAQDQPEIEDQDQPGDEDQDLLGEEDQDVAISFTEEERFARQAAALPMIRICRCRRGIFCPPPERPSGRCSSAQRRYVRCCR